MSCWRSARSLLAIVSLARPVSGLPYHDCISAYCSFIFTLYDLLLHGALVSIPTLTAYYASCSCLPQRSLAICNHKSLLSLGTSPAQANSLCDFVVALFRRASEIDPKPYFFGRFCTFFSVYIFPSIKLEALSIVLLSPQIPIFT
jgi:hypothetical protein